MSWTPYIPNLISGAATILAAFIAVGAGIWAFYRQREHELVQKRYLEEGLDVVISTAENALYTYHHNWARCLELLKSFRDVETMKPGELDVGFLQLPADRFALTANYRVNQIVNSGTVWKVFQLIISFAQTASAVARDEIPAAMKLKLTTDQVEVSRAEMVEEATKVLKDLDKKSHHFYFFFGQLQDISMLLEEQKFALKHIRGLRNHPTVIAAIHKLEKEFSDELKGA